MPRVVDKIIINSRLDDGNYLARCSRFRILELLASELKEFNIPLREADSIRDKLKAACTAFNKAEEVYLRSLDECIDELDSLINSKV